MKNVVCLAILLSGCVAPATLPPLAASHPANPHAPEGFVSSGAVLKDSPEIVNPKPETQKPGHADRGQSERFTCPMHPEIDRAAAGKCPRCGMKLIKKTSTPENGGKQ